MRSWLLRTQKERSKQLVCAVLLSGIFACHAATTSALEFSLHENNSKSLLAVLAVGPVKHGDTARLSSYLAQKPSRKHVAVYLASEGGNLYEGMKLGLFFRNNRIKTVVEGGFDCASACAVAFLGGTDKSGHPWRSSSDNSRLGFHAFRGIQEMSISSDEVQGIVADLLRFGRAVNAPIELLIAGFSTPSNRIFWVSNPDLCALGIKVWSNTYNRFLCN